MSESHSASEQGPALTPDKRILFCEVAGCDRGVDVSVYPDAQRADGTYNCGLHAISALLPPEQP